MNVFKSILMLYVLCLVSQVQAATFHINFWDKSGALVGKGKFNIEFNKVICVSFDEGGVGGDCHNPNSEFIVYKQNPLTSFSTKLLGVPWEGTKGNKWWSAPGQQPGYQYGTQYGVGIDDDLWCFTCDLGTSLALWFFTSNNTSAHGSWDLMSSEYQVASTGNWRASLVPVPTAFWLYASGLYLVGRMKKRANRIRMMR